MPTTKSGNASKSRSSSRGARAAKVAASRKSVAKAAKKPAKKKTAGAAKATTKTKRARGSKKSVIQTKTTKRTSPKTRAKKPRSQAEAKESVGIVAKAKSVLKPVLAGAAAAAAVITGKNADSIETEQSEARPSVSAEAAETDRNAEEPTPNPQRLQDGVLIDRRR